jgi:hypothetical protein
MMEIRPRRPRTTVLLTLVVIIVVAAGIYALTPLRSADEGTRDLPPLRSFDARGFAIWPEDTAREALTACRERAHDEPWRVSATDTIRRFGTQVFGWKRVEIGDDIGRRADRLHIFIYGAPVSLDLGHTVAAFRFGRCWYIADVLPRESGPYADHLWHRGDWGQTLLELRFREEVSERTSIEAGYGGHTETVTGARSLEIEATAGTTGHYLLTDADDRGVVEYATGNALGVPPDLNAPMTRVVRGGFAMYPSSDHRVARDLCSDAESFFDFGRRAREPLISFAMDVLHETSSSNAPEIETVPGEDVSQWIMTTPSIELHYKTFHTSNGCVMLKDVTSPGADIDARVFAGAGVVRVDLGQLEAHEIEIRVAFGDELGVHTEPAPSVYVPLNVNPKAAGYYLVLVRDSGGRLIAAEGHALAPPASQE